MNKNVLKTANKKSTIFGFSADLIITQSALGVLKIYTIFCTDDEREILIDKSIKHGFPFGKIENGLQIFK